MQIIYSVIQEELERMQHGLSQPTDIVAWHLSQTTVDCDEEPQRITLRGKLALHSDLLFI